MAAQRQRQTVYAALAVLVVLLLLAGEIEAFTLKGESTCLDRWLGGLIRSRAAAELWARATCVRP
jgi:hypothetical protein